MAHLRLGKPNQVIEGKTREEWVRAAAKAMISSVDEAMLYKIVRIGGLLEFARVSRPKFKELSGFEFTMDETRSIFLQMEVHLKGLEDQDKVRRTLNRSVKQYEVDEKGDGRIVTENYKGTKVHPERVH